MRVFCEKGYAGSLADVARAADATRPTVYRYFPTKQDLFRAVTEVLLSDLLATVTPAVAAGGDPEDRARRVVDSLLAYGERWPMSWNVLLARGESVDPELEMLQTSLWTGAISTVTHAVAAELGLEDSEIRGPRLQVMSALMLGGAIEVMRWWEANPQAPRTEVVDAVYELLWFGVSRLAAR